MGIVESRILANHILAACEKAEKEGKDQLDENHFCKNAETTKVSKSIYKYIPNNIRRSRQPVIRKAISDSSRQLQVPKTVQDLQYRRKSLFHSQAIENPDSAVALQPASFPQSSFDPTPTSPLSILYNLIVACEEQLHLEKIRLRILCVAIFRLKDAVQPGTRYQYDDASMFIAHVIRNSGCNDPFLSSKVGYDSGLAEENGTV
ncbi:hypothetical protein N7462_008779 [Penicillium macrosclerotiorum]|uniref:uncharacterized protein n=1 Tax=Penicillium macrosclerotiorum TaxID=303699 RepID=UPI002549B858|nr:uncharacterized protein N7462_008779 [Penicillium macrosclerotiorum]KAJ5675882.1 hypothetical protein N7462_008779 [Penicillium macrosclerotiorum]